jgi:putative transposase
MLIRLHQEHTRTFRRIPGGRSVTRSASPPVPGVPKGYRFVGLHTRFLGAYGLADRDLCSGECSRNEIHLEPRKADVAGTTAHPNERWMKQIARSVNMDDWGFLEGCRYLLHDRDRKFTESFRLIVESGGVTPVRLSARSPNLNAYAERWVKSVKDECLSKLILFGEASLRRALREYVAHYHTERNHQGENNVLLFPSAPAREARIDASVAWRERLGGLLKYYHREAA